MMSKKQPRKRVKTKIPFTANKSKIKEALLFICTNPKQGKTVHFWARNNIAASLDERGELKFAEAIREILKDSMILENFTIREIEEKVEDIISRTLQFPVAKREVNIISEINKLLASIVRQIKEYQFVFPISNLRIHRGFQIGDVRFKVFTTYQSEKWARMLRNLIRNNPHYSNKKKREVVRSIVERHIKPLATNVCAETTVKARKERAEEIAKTKIAEAVNILKFYCLVERGPYGGNVGIEGEILGSSVRSILNRSISDGSITPTLERVGPLFPLSIDDKLLKMMKKNGLHKINGMLQSKKRSWVERKILRAIYWYSRIFDTLLKRKDDEKILIKRGISSLRKEEIVEYGRINERLVKTFVALESLLLLDPHEPIQNNIAERMAYILGKDYLSRKEIKRFIKDMYELRSNVVHRGFTYVSVGEIKELTFLVRMAIITIISKKDRLGLRTQQNFYEWFEKKKFS